MVAHDGRRSHVCLDTTAPSSRVIKRRLFSSTANWSIGLLPTRILVICCEWAQHAAATKLRLTAVRFFSCSRARVAQHVKLYNEPSVTTRREFAIETKHAQYEKSFCSSWGCALGYGCGLPHVLCVQLTEEGCRLSFDWYLICVSSGDGCHATFISNRPSIRILTTSVTVPILEKDGGLIMQTLGYTFTHLFMCDRREPFRMEG